MEYNLFFPILLKILMFFPLFFTFFLPSFLKGVIFSVDHICSWVAVDYIPDDELVCFGLWDTGRRSYYLEVCKQVPRLLGLLCND
jgi:hypothetical protein